MKDKNLTSKEDDDKKEKEHRLKDAFNAIGYVNLATAK
jgi:hypothetical protein